MSVKGKGFSHHRRHLAGELSRRTASKRTTVILDAASADFSVIAESVIKFGWNAPGNRQAALCRSKFDRHYKFGESEQHCPTGQAVTVMFWQHSAPI